MSLKTSEAVYLDLFSDMDKQPDFPLEEITKKLAIISTPRSGSSMFCNVLDETRVAGKPREWINKRYMGAYIGYTGASEVDINEYLNFIWRKTATPNGVVGINFHVGQYVELLKHNFDAFRINFDCSYYLQRKEKIDQAYSFAKAIKTDNWTSERKTENEWLGSVDKVSVIEALKVLCRYEDYFEKNLKHRIHKIFIYEDFTQLETTTVFSEVLTDLGETNFEPNWKTVLKKQDNEEDAAALNALKDYILPSWQDELAS